jgi:outer membrane immunogenic protein
MIKKMIVAAALLQPGAASAQSFVQTVLAPTPAVPSWTGFYAGADLGGAFLNQSWNSTSLAFPDGSAEPFSSDPHARLTSGNARIGGYVGYDWQLAPRWVVGAEADIGYANDRGAANQIPGYTHGVAGDNVRTSAGLDAGLVARGGYLLTPTLLAFGDAGMGLQRVSASIYCADNESFCNHPFYPPLYATQSGTQYGYKLGVGLDDMITEHLIARVDFQFTGLSDFKYNLKANILENWGMTARIPTYASTVSAGLAYKF